MACSNCGSGGSPSGCGSKGDCGTGGCNRMNTYDWISTLDIHDPTVFNLVEVSFKNGASKEFFKKENYADCVTGDIVVVSTDSGYDVGRLSLSGELVRRQMKKKKVAEKSIKNKVIRVANERDLEKMDSARASEKNSLVKARVIARTLGLDMKIGDVEFQADQRKATFYYTAEGRVDFRQLVRDYAKEFKVKIEMRQIGARQESARIGGIGSCGRELCCSTWLSDFQTVTTSAARYQNIAINQTKLSGQCGRLKCCLNYELDSYMDALKAFPKKADVLRTKKGKAVLIKTDIFKQIMFYSHVEEKARGPIVPLGVDRVKEIIQMNRDKKYPEDLIDIHALIHEEVEKEMDYGDVTGHIELPSIKKKKRRNKKRPQNRNNKPKPQNKSNDRNSKTKEGEGNNIKSNSPTKDANNSAPKSNNSNRRKKRPNNQNRKKQGNSPKGNQNTPNNANGTGNKKTNPSTNSNGPAENKPKTVNKKPNPQNRNNNIKNSNNNTNRNNKANPNQSNHKDNKSNDK